MCTFNTKIITVVLATSTMICYTNVIQATQNHKTTTRDLPTQNQLQIQQKIPCLEDERNEIKDLLAANEILKEELATVKISREMAKKDAQNAREELEQMKNAMAENQSSMDAILNDIQNTKKDLADSMIANEVLRNTLTESYKRTKVSIKQGDLVAITPDITPARPMNLSRMAIKNNHIFGVVVVNVLISENGEALDARLLQGLPGHGELVDKANAACVEQAKRIIFDPARAADGKTRVRVWQGIGILLN